MEIMHSFLLVLFNFYLFLLCLKHTLFLKLSVMYVLKSVGLLKEIMLSELVYNFKMLDWISKFLLFLFKIGTIVSIGDPKKNTQDMKKIGQGVSICDCITRIVFIF